jgi:hypothetical protein
MLDANLSRRIQLSIQRPINVITLEISDAMRVDSAQAGPHQHIRGVVGLIVQITKAKKHLVYELPQ